MSIPRITQRIPREQRARRKREFSLGPEAHAVLDALPPREASRYVEHAVLEQAKRDQRSYERALRRSLRD